MFPCPLFPSRLHHDIEVIRVLGKSRFPHYRLEAVFPAFLAPQSVGGALFVFFLSSFSYVEHAAAE